MKSREGVQKHTIALVGNPNVGKSVLFHLLTRTYATVSNYPGTTVEVSRGRWKGDVGTQVVDTPGLYALLPITVEERVARDLLIGERPRTVIQVIDSKNLERMLPLAFQLIEAGFPLVIDLNIIDEADRLGIRIDVGTLEKELGTPVVATSGVSGRGIDRLEEIIREESLAPDRAKEETGDTPPFIDYGPRIERALDSLCALLRGAYPISRRAIALLLLQGDEEIAGLIDREEGLRAAEISQIVDQARSGPSVEYAIGMRRSEMAHRLAARCLSGPRAKKTLFAERLSRIMIRPLTGIPILLVVLYAGLFLFVGVFGAGTLVDLLEVHVFEGLVNPVLIGFFQRYVPWPVVRDLFTGEYGVLTLGLRYAVAIILPIVGTFFLIFSVLEDTGYFPRLAQLVDRVFKRIGLSGRAAIPIVLGFGCDTMATMVTRTLETKREKIIATLLLALAIPCSAQLGVILGVLSGNRTALFLWMLVITAVFLLAGFLSAMLMPGTRPGFYMELPPLRFPKIGNVFAKTLSRMRWYFVEIIPFFLLASVVIWIGQITNLFQLLVAWMKPIMGWIGLPGETAVVFIFGFFRRDYGAAGLYDMWRSGLLSWEQLVVVAVTLTLFLPCIAQFGVMLKERGWRTTLGITLFIFPFAFAVGFVLHTALEWVSL
jgi:ferrous iron transport protein B